jgi:hypothetical protein
MGIFHLDNLLVSEDTPENNIIRILHARGFLIENYEGKCYLSDNASYEDLIYLQECFEKYDLGHIVEHKLPVIKTRRSWAGLFTNGSNPYKALLPFSAEIILNDNVSVENAIELFHDIRQDGSEAGGEFKSWTQFAIERCPPKTPVRKLEPYVAYYVKAISSCGVYTCYSCDGNHKNGGRIIVGADYPSNLWHECIWDNVVVQKFGEIPYIENGIVFDDMNQTALYQRLYDIASFLYKNREQIRRLKADTLKWCNKRYIKSHSNVEMDSIYRTQCSCVFEGNNVIY